MAWANRSQMSSRSHHYPQPSMSEHSLYLKQILETEILAYCTLPRSEGGDNRVSKEKESKGDYLPNFNFDNICRHLNRKYGLSLAIDQLTELLEFLPEYTMHRPSGHLYTQGTLTKSTPIPPLVFNVLFKTIVVPDPNDRRPLGKTKKNVKRQPKMMLHNLTDTQTVRIFNAVVALDVSAETKLLSKACYMLQLREKMATFGPRAVQAVTEGWASFASTIFFMHNPSFSQYFLTAEVIRTALCLGPLRATTVESFAMNRSEAFRESCRQLLLQAESAAMCRNFLSFCPPYLAHRYGAIRFEVNTRALMDELRGETRHDPLINPGWAFAAIKKYAKKTFVDKEWAYENFHELCWTIIYQRPNMRKNVIAAVKPEGDQLVSYWQNVSMDGLTIADVPRDIPMVMGDPLDASIVPGGPFLSFAPEVREIVFVDTAQLVSEMSADIERRSESPGGVMIALDAEWSAYESYSAATVLQLGLHDIAYIVDLDRLPKEVLRPFIDMLFGHPKILKLGFQFHEDLAQLRLAKSLRGCAALYHPQNLSCVSKLIVALTEECDRRPNGQDLLEEFGVAIVPTSADSSFQSSQPQSQDADSAKDGGGGAVADVDEFNDSTDMELAGSSTSPENPQGITRPRPSTVVTRVANRSLSSLCESLLGLPLDKREQCSVWTRRPLRTLQVRVIEPTVSSTVYALSLLDNREIVCAMERPLREIYSSHSQLRYAAMDAYCLLLLHARCGQWAQRLGVPLEDMMSHHEPSCSLPLFLGD